MPQCRGDTMHGNKPHSGQPSSSSVNETCIFIFSDYVRDLVLHLFQKEHVDLCKGIHSGGENLKEPH